MTKQLKSKRYMRATNAYLYVNKKKKEFGKVQKKNNRLLLLL